MPVKTKDDATEPEVTDTTETTPVVKPKPTAKTADDTATDNATEVGTTPKGVVPSPDDGPAVKPEDVTNANDKGNQNAEASLEAAKMPGTGDLSLADLNPAGTPHHDLAQMAANPGGDPTPSVNDVTEADIAAVAASTKVDNWGPIIAQSEGINQVADKGSFRAGFLHQPGNWNDDLYVRQHLDELKAGTIVRNGLPASYWQSGEYLKGPPKARRTGNGYSVEE